MSLYDFLPKQPQHHELFDLLPKHAEETERPKSSIMKSILQEVGGMGIGTLAGAGGAHYLEKAHKHLTRSAEFPQGKPFSPALLLSAAPIIGAGLGLAYNAAKSRQQKQLGPPQEQEQ